MSPRSEDDKRIKPGILVDKELWEQFKKKFEGTASQKIEQLMADELNPPAVIHTVFSSQDLNSVSFDNPEQWSLSYTNSSIKVANNYTTSYTTLEELKDIDFK